MWSRYQRPNLIPPQMRTIKRVPSTPRITAINDLFEPDVVTGEGVGVGRGGSTAGLGGSGYTSVASPKRWLTSGVPSSKQNDKSSLKVRLHSGQIFIGALTTILY